MEPEGLTAADLPAFPSHKGPFTMGRRRKGKSVEIKLLIPEQLYFEFEKALTGNFTKKPDYGIRSQLISALIQRWLKERAAKQSASIDDQPPKAANSN